MTGFGNSNYDVESIPTAITVPSKISGSPTPTFNDEKTTNNRIHIIPSNLATSFLE